MKTYSLFPKNYMLDAGDKRKVAKANSHKATKLRSQNKIDVHELALFVYEGELKK